MFHSNPASDPYIRIAATTLKLSLTLVSHEHCLLSLAFNASALKGYSGCDSYICVNATVIKDTVTCQAL